jgi:hypothetical protein
MRIERRRRRFWPKVSFALDFCACAAAAEAKAAIRSTRLLFERIDACGVAGILRSWCLLGGALGSFGTLNHSNDVPTCGRRVDGMSRFSRLRLNQRRS